MIEPVVAAQPGAVGARQPLALAGGQRLGFRDARERGVVGLAALMRPLSRIQAQAGGGEGRKVEVLLHEAVEQRRQLRVGGLGARRGGERQRGGAGFQGGAAIQHGENPFARRIEAIRRNAKGDRKGPLSRMRSG
jgi:hypothetical protein